ncbi:hypothetical protein Q4555_01325 [Octadecabacter sp. 1_MG-2023]|uniref:hypothetical protein n=1 Tax=unclassified Octadecabacter TaxID=196158 RepID=UPI001C0968D2|nr:MULTISPECIES: hypothetical protein [unclassified Octadecabacter]MBU2993255.1 hypothetical protein [Octadecabacter sp. B2R22]MDO6733290.1 hypothetical protein [Octadecabacter sp. 1_MG-2023]
MTWTDTLKFQPDFPTVMCRDFSLLDQTTLHERQSDWDGIVRYFAGVYDLTVAEGYDTLGEWATRRLAPVIESAAA